MILQSDIKKIEALVPLVWLKLQKKKKKPKTNQNSNQGPAQ